MKRLLPAVTLALALAAASAVASTWVLPPEAATEVAALIGADRPLGGGQALTAALDRDHVVLTILAGDTAVTRVTLRHPGSAAPAAERLGGVAIERTPGPVDETLLAEVRDRMKASGVEVHWREASAGPRPSGGGVEGDLRGATRAARLQRKDAARAALERLPDTLTARQALLAAALWGWVGDTARRDALVARAKEGASPAVAAMARAIEDPDALPDLLALAGAPSDRCVLADAADLVAELGHHEAAVKLGQAILEGDPACLRARTRLAYTLLHLDQRDLAAAQVEEALARAPDDPAVLAARAALLAATPPSDDALASLGALEALARRDPRAPRHLAYVADAVARLPDGDRAARRASYRAALARDPGDPVARFLVGAEALADGDFTRAREVLGPLAAELDDVPAVAVALAVATFELGDTKGALALLDRATAMSTLDPDVYYERAEILRVRELEPAKEALETYLDACDSVGCDVGRQERAGQLIEVVDRCIREGAPECESDHWEHPRAKGTAPVGAPASPPPVAATPPAATPAAAPAPAPPSDDGAPALPLAVGAAALVLLVGLALALRRKKR